jgi:hypothetical protein
MGERMMNSGNLDVFTLEKVVGGDLVDERMMNSGKLELMCLV